MSKIGDFFAPMVGQKTTAERDADNSAQANLQQAKDLFSNVQLPTLQNVNYQAAGRAPDVIQERAGAIAPVSQNTAGVTLAGAQGQDASALNNIRTNPADLQAAHAQLAALQNLAANGGRNATTDANLAAIQQQENQNARGQREAILQNMNARGMGSSGASLLAQLSASQNAINNQSAQDLGIAGQEANTMLGAGSQAANLGMGLQSQDYSQKAQEAAAQDAINRFNAQNQTSINQANAQAQNQGAEFNAAQGNQLGQYNAGLQNQINQYNASQANALGEYNNQLEQQYLNNKATTANQNQQTNKLQIPQQNFGNAMQKAGASAGVNQAGVNYFNNQANIGAQASGNMLGAAVKLGTAGFSSGGAPAAAAKGTGAASTATEAAEAAAAHGGRLPGVPMVHGDSPLNDFLPIKASPGEVVVPRSLALGGSPHQISNFVRQAPTIHMGAQRSMDPAKDKEAMLSALKHMHRR